MSVLPLSLDQIISLSAIAFQGNIIEYKIDHDPQSGFIVTYTTFKVQEVFKGKVGATYTMKQFNPMLAVNPNLPLGVSNLVEGSSNICFLSGVSEIGLSSPFGEFNIIQDAAVLNDFSPPVSERYIISPAPLGLERIGLEEFKQLVRQKIGM